MFHSGAMCSYMQGKEAYKEIFDISLLLILTFHVGSFTMANTREDFFQCVELTFLRKCVGEILIVHGICFNTMIIQHTIFQPIINKAKVLH